VAGQFAEIIESPEYRQALTDAFDTADVDAYVDQRAAAELLIASNLRLLQPGGERIWELRRQAALTELGGTALGAFGTYIHQQGGDSTPSTMSAGELMLPGPEIVRTNGQIMGLNRIEDEPIDFLNAAMDAISGRAKDAVGLGNYATALKFFSDKFIEFPSSHLDQTEIIHAVERCMDGFLGVTESRRPNFIEMTNIYVAIRTLPRGTFGKKYTEAILGHSLEQMPNYHAQSLAMMISSMSRLDLSETAESAATLVDLALRKSTTMERTTNMIQAIRTIANLPASSAAEQTFGTFLKLRNNLEQPQDLQGLDIINFALLHIVKNVIKDPELSAKAKALAEQCARSSARYVDQKVRAGNTTPEEIAHMKKTVGRIFYNCGEI
jgi:hypothetical protein